MSLLVKEAEKLERIFFDGEDREKYEPLFEDSLKNIAMHLIREWLECEYEHTHYYIDDSQYFRRGYGILDDYAEKFARELKLI